MEYFKITNNNNGTITIVSNTKWLISVDGNFGLSKLSSSGSSDGSNETFDIDILIDETEPFANGVIYYSYGIGYCKDIKSLQMSYTNPLYFYVEPTSIELSGVGTIQTVTVHSNYEWHVSNTNRDQYIAIPCDNIIYVISQTNDNFGVEEPLTTDIVSVYNSSKLNVKQNIQTVSNCKLYATYAFNGKYNLSITVTSLQDDNFADFTWSFSHPETLTVMRVENNVLNVSINTDAIDTWNVVFKNNCKSYILNFSNTEIDVDNEVFYFEVNGEKYGYYNGKQQSEYELSYDNCNMTDVLNVSAVSENTLTGEKINWLISSYDNTQLNVEGVQGEYYNISLKDDYDYNNGESQVIFINSSGKQIIVNCKLDNSLNGMCYNFVCNPDETSTSSMYVDISCKDRVGNDAFWIYEAGHSTIESTDISGYGDKRIHITCDYEYVPEDVFETYFKIILRATNDYYKFNLRINKQSSQMILIDIEHTDYNICNECN